MKPVQKTDQSGCPTTIRARGEVRTDCKTKISIVRQQNGPRWCVSVFIEGHNHGLSTPSKVHLLRSHRSVSAAKKVLTQQLSEANIPTCQQMQLLEIESGGQSPATHQQNLYHIHRRLSPF